MVLVMSLMTCVSSVVSKGPMLLPTTSISMSDGIVNSAVTMTAPAAMRKSYGSGARPRECHKKTKINRNPQEIMMLRQAPDALLPSASEAANENAHDMFKKDDSTPEGVFLYKDVGKRRKCEIIARQGRYPMRSSLKNAWKR